MLRLPPLPQRRRRHPGRGGAGADQTVPGAGHRPAAQSERPVETDRAANPPVADAPFRAPGRNPRVEQLVQPGAVPPLRIGERAASEAPIPFQLLRTVAFGEAAGGVVRQAGGKFDQSAQVAGAVRAAGASAAALRTPQVAAAAAVAPSAAPAPTAIFAQSVHEVLVGSEEEDHPVGATRGPNTETGRGLFINQINRAYTNVHKF